MEPNGSLRGVRIERRGVGYAAHGPHFYVWDEDVRVLLATACALASTQAPSAPLHPRPQRTRAAGARSRR
jgi:hypothetical protein